MTLMHIATPESFMTDLKSEGICTVCGHQATIRYGYFDCHCSICNLYYESGCFMGTIVYKIRVAMGLGRREFAHMLGIKHKTLSNSENCRCSKVIFDKSRAIFHEFVKQNNKE